MSNVQLPNAIIKYNTQRIYRYMYIMVSAMDYHVWVERGREKNRIKIDWTTRNSIIYFFPSLLLLFVDGNLLRVDPCVIQTRKTNTHEALKKDGLWVEKKNHRKEARAYDYAMSTLSDSNNPINTHLLNNLITV